MEGKPSELPKYRLPQFFEHFAAFVQTVQDEHGGNQVVVVNQPALPAPHLPGHRRFPVAERQTNEWMELYRLNGLEWIKCERMVNRRGRSSCAARILHAATAQAAGGQHTA